MKSIFKDKEMENNDSCKIGNHQYTICITNIFGFVDYTLRNIKISHISDDKILVLLHEAIHIISRENKLNLTEHAVETLASQIIEFCRVNDIDLRKKK